MKPRHILILAALLFVGCATRPTRTTTADRTWEHLGHPADGPDAPRIDHPVHGPNHGPR